MVPETARAAVLAEPGRIEQRGVEVPQTIAESQALLEVEACGLCGTDLAQFEGELEQDYPLIPGHEVVGRIVEIGGSARKRWEVDVGSRVAVCSPEGCGVCEYCTSGRANLCPQRFSYGFEPLTRDHGLWGGYAEYMVLRPNTTVIEVPSELDAHEATLFNPLGNGIQWVHHAEVEGGDSVLVLGPGQRGLTSTLWSRERGAERVVVTGLSGDSHKLALAESFGATETVDIEKTSIKSVVDDRLGGEQFDSVIDTTPGAVTPITDGLDVLGPGGKLVLTGHKHGDEVSIDVDEIIINEHEIKGAFIEHPWADREAIRLLSQNTRGILSMHTDEFGLTNIETALEALAGGTDTIHVSVAPDWEG